MGQRGSQPTAYFYLSTKRGVPLQRVHEMLGEVVRLMGRTNCGEVQVTEPCNHGRYLVIFYERSAADVFERLYRRPAIPRSAPPGCPRACASWKSKSSRWWCPHQSERLHAAYERTPELTSRLAGWWGVPRHPARQPHLPSYWHIKKQPRRAVVG